MLFVYLSEILFIYLISGNVIPPVEDIMPFFVFRYFEWKHSNCLSPEGNRYFVLNNWWKFPLTVNLTKVNLLY